jgi:hypothetical protein
VERDAAVKFARFALFVSLLAGSGGLQAADRQVVLVVSADSPVQQLEQIEVKKLFLGWPVTRGDRTLRPICNASDAALNDVFLQYVVAMSQSAYDRRILSQVLQHGRPRPLELTSSAATIKMLTADPYAVSYMWLKEVPLNPRLRILRVLWAE